MTSFVSGWRPTENSHLFLYPFSTGDLTNGSRGARLSFSKPGSEFHSKDKPDARNNFLINSLK